MEGSLLSSINCFNFGTYSRVNKVFYPNKLYIKVYIKLNHVDAFNLFIWEIKHLSVNL